MSGNPYKIDADGTVDDGDTRSPAADKRRATVYGVLDSGGHLMRCYVIAGHAHKYAIGMRLRVVKIECEYEVKE